MRSSVLLALAACGTPQPSAELSWEAAIDEGYDSFVTAPNAEVSGRDDLSDPEVRDAVFASYLEASFLQHLGAWRVFQRLESVRSDYSTVLASVRSAGLPEVVAAVPYVESGFHTEAQSPVCAKGPWQFMPEVAHRTGLEVSGCAFADDPDADWAPIEGAPPQPIFSASAYARNGTCQITGCATDERTDLDRSTEAALGLFAEVWADPEFRMSGSAVQITVGSHNAGYDDARFTDRGSRHNMKPAFLDWSADKDPRDHARFYGDNIRSASPAERVSAASVLTPETQHYAYTVVAVHLLAACYYGQSPAGDSNFAAYADHAESWCQAFDIPTREAVLASGQP